MESLRINAINACNEMIAPLRNLVFLRDHSHFFQHWKRRRKGECERSRHCFISVQIDLKNSAKAAIESLYIFLQKFHNVTPRPLNKREKQCFSYCSTIDGRNNRIKAFISIFLKVRPTLENSYKGLVGKNLKKACSSTISFLSIVPNLKICWKYTLTPTNWTQSQKMIVKILRMYAHLGTLQRIHFKL